MSDTIKAWHEMQDKEIIVADESASIYFYQTLQTVKYIDMTLARYVQMKINGILTQNLVKRFYTAQVTK